MSAGRFPPEKGDRQVRKLFLIFTGGWVRGRKSLVKGVLLGAAFWLLGSSAAFSQNTELIFGRKNTFGIGPRAMGMGGAFTAVADDASAAYWNAAGLAQLTSYEISISSAPVYFQDNVNGAPAFGFPWYASMQFMVPIAKDNTLGRLFPALSSPNESFLVQDATLSSAGQQEKKLLFQPQLPGRRGCSLFRDPVFRIRNFSIGVNIKQINNDPYYIRYFGTDLNIQKELKNPIKVVGYGVDLGILYRYPFNEIF